MELLIYKTITSDQKIAEIKLFREITGLGLKNSVDAINEIINTGVSKVYFKDTPENIPDLIYKLKSNGFKTPNYEPNVDDLRSRLIAFTNDATLLGMDELSTDILTVYMRYFEI